ncbi:MAG TPA: acetoacetate--CoA ligase [Acidimicrobiales bacterium]|nr:acetoacetate--CoA ligase [Acidimicrobiales bacterium]
MSERGELLWKPPADVLDHSEVGRYIRWLGDKGMSFAGYQDLWRWSVDDLEAFWGSLWEYFDIQATTPPEMVLGDESRTGFMPGRLPAHRWFPGATLNYASHALRGAGRAVGPALIAHSQSRAPVSLSASELSEQVTRCRAGLERLGVGRGDRVAAYLPNIPEAVVALLATASLGAIWSSCAPEFGTRSVLDRLRQIEPVVLLAVDGYRYGAKEIDRVGEVAAIRADLPTVRSVVTVPYLDPGARLDGSLTWDELLADPGSSAGGAGADVEALPVPFDHPLYVLYSSGTTGLPKPIVHGHGGILLEHCKALSLHSDLGPGDRFFWFSTTGWMMWNFLVSGLLVGATPVLFDGDPGSPDLGSLWRLAGEVGVTYFGTSAPYLLACRKAGVSPGAEADLSKVRTIGSTGAPLPPEGFRWVHDELGDHAVLASISGGTDVCTAFVGGSPLMPVRAGEIPCRYLGAKVEAFDEEGESVVGRQGELVISAPLPSMPVGFWGDVDGSRYRAAYFEGFPGVWTHGDWITLYEDGACVITGRSDATLNRGGVRMGTAELYSVVDAQPEVADSLVIHLEDSEGGGPGRLLLFVQLAEGAALDDALRSRIARALRSELSPRHVPDEIHAVPGIPRTLSGKKLEIPVKRILTGTPPDAAASRGSLTNPETLDAFTPFAIDP